MATKVLIVDDHPAIRTTMKDVLENEGFETVLAESGERAVEIYRDNYFDFVLMDMQMPGMKGVDAFRQMLQGEQKHARFIFISAFSSPELEKEAQQLGCIEFLHKPIRIEDVVKLIREKLRTSILLFIENKDLQENVAQEVEKEGYTLEKALSIDQALINIRQIDHNFIIIDEDSPSFEQNALRKTIKVTNSKSQVVEINEDEQVQLVIQRIQKLSG